MLPSIGYFKTLNCPFYVNGLCERSYCHFKHNKTDAHLNPTTSNFEAHELHNQNSLFGQSLYNTSSEVKKGSNKDDNSISNKFQEKGFLEHMAKAIQTLKNNVPNEMDSIALPDNKALEFNKIEYANETEIIEKLNYPHTEYHPRSNLKLYPEYKPTPINQLKNNKHISNNCHEDSMVSPEMIKMTLKYLSNLPSDKFENLKAMFINNVDVSELIYKDSETSTNSNIDKSIYTIFKPESKELDAKHDAHNNQNVNTNGVNYFFTKPFDNIKEDNNNLKTRDNSVDLLSPLSPDQEDPDTGVELNRKTYGYVNKESMVNDDHKYPSYGRTFALNGKSIQLDEKTTRVIAAADITNYTQRKDNNTLSNNINDKKKSFEKSKPSNDFTNKINQTQCNDIAPKMSEPPNIDVDIFATTSNIKKSHVVKSTKSKTTKPKCSVGKNLNSDKMRINGSLDNEKLQIGFKVKQTPNNSKTSNNKDIDELFNNNSEDDNVSMISISEDENDAMIKPVVKETTLELSPRKYKKSVIHERISDLSNQIKLNAKKNASIDDSNTKNIILKVEGKRYNDPLSNEDNCVSKKRIAHSSNIPSEKMMRTIQPSFQGIVQPHPASIMLKRFSELAKKAESNTNVLDLNKGSEEEVSKKRVAHVPCTTVIKEFVKRPHLKLDTASNSTSVGVNVRQRYLNLIHDECLKLCQLPQPSGDKNVEAKGGGGGGDGGEIDEAEQMAILEEQQIYDKCRHTKSIYFNLAVACIKRLRSEVVSQTTRLVPSNNKNHHKKHIKHVMGLDDFALHLKRYHVLALDQLKENGFPIPDESSYNQSNVVIAFYDNPDRLPRPVPSRYDSRLNRILELPEEHEGTPHNGTITRQLVCSRCGTEYRLRLGPGPAEYAYLDAPTSQTSNSPFGRECVYHWGKAWKTRATKSRAWETRYTCCKGDVGAPGCTLAAGHVTDTPEPSYLARGWVRTTSPTTPSPSIPKVYALDCEMVYTPWGPECARVTVVGCKEVKGAGVSDEVVIYESLILPTHYPAVVDYNTRFSGIKESTLAEPGVPTLQRVQADLCKLIRGDDILIGHSLESDLLALKMVHLTVVDTSVVFPHRLGRPYKRALKNLMSEHLKRIIQDDVDGHDSKEDAASCLQLMKWKVKQDLPKMNL